jgi:hypothetical protein
MRDKQPRRTRRELLTVLREMVEDVNGLRECAAREPDLGLDPRTLAIVATNIQQASLWLRYAGEDES